MRFSAVRLALCASLIVAAAQPAAHQTTSQPSAPLHPPDHNTVVAFARVRDPGVVALLRHAQAPGTGDPGNFVIDDCTTQRGLSEQGRQQARALGQVLRRAGVREAQIVSSAWCRCLETARLLGLGRVEVAGFLGSIFVRRDARDEATGELRRVVLAKTGTLVPTILVTHQVNITAATGLVPSEGEMIFVRGTAAGALEVVGRATLGR